MASQNTVNNTGLPTAGNNSKGRWYGADGQPNIIKRGAALKHRFSIFHFLLSIGNLKFLLLTVSTYFVINIFFASLYYLVGPESLGLQATNRCSNNDFWNCFFFSAQTLTTVGYGTLSPRTVPANVISAIESLLGLLLFALITGLSYARFSRPKGAILFSRNALFTPYEGGKALMFRIVSARNDMLSDIKVHVIAALNILNEHGAEKLEFFTLKLEVDNIQTLVLNWTLVHVINEESPFWGLSIADLQQKNFELLVSVQGYDEYYSNVVKSRVSYVAEQLVDDAKFDVMFSRNDDNGPAELHIDRLHNFRKL
jgi:inward rectifier potassium channel